MTGILNKAMRPILLEIGLLKIYSFGTFIALGAIVGTLVTARLALRFGLKDKKIYENVLYSLVSALIFARIGYFLVYREEFQSFWQILALWQGGLVAITGLIGGFLIYYNRLRQQNQPLARSLDAAGIGLLFGLTVGRIGCHLATCTLGRVYTGPLAVNNGYPIDLISGIWTLVLAFTLVALIRRQLQSGVLFFLAIEGLFLGELLIKTLRADFGSDYSKLETVVSLIIIAGVYLVFWRLHGPQSPISPRQTVDRLVESVRSSRPTFWRSSWPWGRSPKSGKTRL